ncbi:pentatricopeptide repeat-containing protein At1g69290 [Primulina huaijiensis]|uniref:pentatricopeptide repeat-containing protein At1g69290 n=1 Tax=Primulina huaijiensis TaxID=1492673 RepID=UPI003CC78E82
MWRRAACLLSRRSFSSEQEIPSLYSFLQPSIFALRRTTSQPQATLSKPQENSLSQAQRSNLETNLQQFLFDHYTDEAWKAFKTFTNCSSFPSKSLTNSLIIHLSSLSDAHNIKRAFASVVYLLEKNPSLLEHESVKKLLDSLKIANSGAPAFALVRNMLKNRFFMPFEMWGVVLVDICRQNGSFDAFLSVFHESCRISIDEKLNLLKPDLVACNAVLECYCRELESISDAEKVIETMSVLGVRPDKFTLGFLGYLYALKGLQEKVMELDSFMGRFGISDKKVLSDNVIRGYVKSGDLQSASATILRYLKEGEEQCFSEGTCNEIVEGFLQNGNLKGLANLVVESQKLEPASFEVDKSVGYGVITACINLGLLDKAQNILHEMNVQGASVGLGAYVPILKAYSREKRTAEAAQLVSEICNLGLPLDVVTYDSLIESSMSCQDFRSAFSLYRDMRESRVCELKGSYLTIMTGLTEHHRPELMAAFMDEVVQDPRVEVGTHDWNSIIHAFCKAGRMGDARRTFRRMIFLQFEPNEQTYLSLINGYVAMEKYFSVLLLWNEVKRKVFGEGEKRLKLDNSLVDAFLFALVRGGFFDAVMQVVEKSQEMKIFVDKWRYKQAFMENHKKLRVSNLRRRNFRKMESLIAFKNWAGLST